MKFLALEALQHVNPLVRRDYTHDYRASSVPAALQLERPTSEQLRDAFASIRQELAIPTDTLHDIYTSVIDGKHILLYGPPGTGKTTLAGCIAEKLFNCKSRFETATADWTPFETIGGLQLVTKDGQEHLEPVPGVITEAIVACLNQIAEHAFDASAPQGVWLVLDELNRANMDAAFGPLFTALDQRHPQVSLPFFDEPRRNLVVPRRFRIIATMNTYDKNFLFRLSYALTRRFALIPINVPANDDESGRQEERAKLWLNLQSALKEQGVRDATVAQLQTDYDEVLMKPLYDDLVTMIRAVPATRAEGLGRSLGFAQIAAALRHAVFEIELGLVSVGAALDALDRGVRSSIVPQLEGLSNAALQEFVKWWEQQDTLRRMHRSMAAVRELMRGANLFLTE